MVDGAATDRLNVSSITACGAVTVSTVSLVGEIDVSNESLEWRKSRYYDTK